MGELNRPRKPRRPFYTYSVLSGKVTPGRLTPRPHHRSRSRNCLLRAEPTGLTKLFPPGTPPPQPFENLEAGGPALRKVAVRLVGDHMSANRAQFPAEKRGHQHSGDQWDAVVDDRPVRLGAVFRPVGLEVGAKGMAPARLDEPGGVDASPYFLHYFSRPRGAGSKSRRQSLLSPTMGHPRRPTTNQTPYATPKL